MGIWFPLMSPFSADDVKIFIFLKKQREYELVFPGSNELRTYTEHSANENMCNIRMKNHIISQ